MALLNYSTTVPAAKTAQQIITLLGLLHAKAILLENDHLGNLAAISFKMQTEDGERHFKLPVDAKACEKVLQRQYDQGDRAIRPAMTTPEHARRVAWRINLEWLKLQAALIEAAQATVVQVFLPYMLVADGRTVFQLMQAQQFKALPAGEANG